MFTSRSQIQENYDWWLGKKGFTMKVHEITFLVFGFIKIIFGKLMQMYPSGLCRCACVIHTHTQSPYKLERKNLKLRLVNFSVYMQTYSA